MTCANCIHNCKKLDICWMWGTPPDNQDLFHTAENCQYYEEDEDVH